MSKAEDRAYEAYPKMSRISEPHGVIPADNESHYLGDANEEKREGFIVGYHQAEKDLMENKHEKSWRLDEKSWSGIKDAEEASYQYVYDASNDWAYDVPTWDDVQEAFKAGSEWKEGLELTLEDVKKISALIANIFNERNMYYPVSPEEQEEFYHEVLKRFKEYKRQQANSCKI